jgi:glycosyltransferase involved in cell wall biosynthesis
MRKRVLLLRRTGGMGGTERCILDWLEAADYTRNEVTVGTNCSSLSSVLQKRLPVRTVPLTPPFHGSVGRVFCEWVWYLRQLEPETVILIEGGFPDFPLAAVLAAFVSSRGNVYGTLHTLPPLPLPRSSRRHWHVVPGLGIWWYARRLSAALRGHLLRRTLAVSESVRTRVVEHYGYPSGRTRVIYHGVDVNRFSPIPGHADEWKRAHGIPEGALLISSTSRLSPEKRLDWLIKAFAGAAASHKDAWLVLAGDGPLAGDLRALSHRLGISDRVRFLGIVEDVAPLLLASSVFALTSAVEGFSLGLMEAMSCGLICLAASYPGALEIVVDGVNGILCEQTEEGVLKGLKKILGLSTEEKNALSRNARNTITDRFEIGSSVNAALSLLGIDSSAKATREVPAPHVAW